MDEENVDSPQAVDEAAEAPEASPPAGRGRPKGKADASVRTRRTAAQVAEDKIALAQAKVDALKLQLQAKEAAKAAARKKPERKTRVAPPPPSDSDSSEEPPPPRKRKKKVRTPSSSSTEEPPPRVIHRASPNSRRKALYQSWFTR